MNTILLLVNKKLKVDFLFKVFQDSLSIGYINIAEIIMFDVDINSYSLDQLVALILEKNKLKEEKILIIESIQLQVNDSDKNNIQ